ncbi:MAG TPA: xanthine dehydrogenase family protein molybdopterin-binding subunit [Chloroflexota bacterium]|nr:xanthine dehydrogenase family protein molybdopterin-binding subunit [Chloroflexota bacterium]
MVDTVARSEGIVGQRAPRVDALDKVTGRAKYTADLKLPGMLHGAFLRSPHAHARILRIDTSKAEALPGVKAVLTQDRLAGRVSKIVDEEHGTSYDFQAFARAKVKFQGQKVGAVAAVTKEIAEEAVRLIEVEYEVLPAAVDVLEAIKPDAPIIHEDEKPLTTYDGRVLRNVVNQVDVVEGDVEQGFDESDYLFEDTYVIPRAHQAYIEPQVAIAEVAPTGKITVWTSTQGIFASRSNIARAIGVPPRVVNVIGMTIGGGFGAKVGGGVVDIYAVLLARETGRPVKVVYNREEEFLDARPAQGLTITIKTGVRKDGKILARKAIGYWDIGQQGRGAWRTDRIRSVYDFPHLETHGYDVITNKPLAGAYRAPCGPQVAFASESQLNKIARKLGMDPIEFRLINLKAPTAQTDFPATLRAIAERAGWSERTKGPGEGWGVAIGHWLNGSQPANALCTLQDDGSLTVFSGLMDISGSDTSIAQVAADAAGASLDKVTVVRGDTDSAPMAPNSGGSNATYSVGNAVQRAGTRVKERILSVASDMLEASAGDLEIRGNQVWVRGVPARKVSFAQVAQKAGRSKGGPIAETGGFDALPSAMTIAAQIVKVSVDPDTGKVTLRYAGQSLDCGKALNPMSVEGQMEGGMVQSMGWGLWEQLSYAPDGRMLNPGFLDYHLATAADIPDLECELLEIPTLNGPYGAKGVAEPPITPGIAAVQGAILDAVGVDLHEAPFTPERVRAAIKEK